MDDYRILRAFERQVFALKMLVMTNIMLTLLTVSAFGLWEYRLHQLRANVARTFTETRERFAEQDLLPSRPEDNLIPR